MLYFSKTICFGVLVLVSVGCSYLNPFDRDAKIERFGPDQWYSLVVYFKSGTTAEQVEAFKFEVLSKPGSDVKAQEFKEGIGSYWRLTPEHAHGRWAFAITYYK